MLFNLQVAIEFSQLQQSIVRCSHKSALDFVPDDYVWFSIEFLALG